MSFLYGDFEQVIVNLAAPAAAAAIIFFITAATNHILGKVCFHGFFSFLIIFELRLSAAYPIQGTFFTAKSILRISLLWFLGSNARAVDGLVQLVLRNGIQIYLVADFFDSFVHGFFVEESGRN